MKRMLLTFLLLCLLLAACAGPVTPSPRPDAGNRPAPSEMVLQFFAALEAKDYTKAYSMLNRAFQKEIPQDIFQQQLEQSIGQEGITKQASEIMGEKIQGDTATVSYRLLSTLANGLEQEGRGIYTLHWEDGAWKINLLPEEPSPTSTSTAPALPRHPLGLPNSIRSYWRPVSMHADPFGFAELASLRRGRGQKIPFQDAMP
jgi:hypothetical protein